MLRVSVLLAIACIHCNAQFYTFNNEQRTGEFNKSCCETTHYSVEDVMDPFVYKTLFKPMLQSVGEQLDQSKNPEDKIEHEVEDSQFENVTEIIVIETTNDPANTTQLLPTVPVLPSQCVVDLGHFNYDLQLGEDYAWLMLDAYGKPPPGIFQGAVTWPGLYDLCQSQSKSSNETNFTGKQCLVFLASFRPKALFKTVNIGMCVPDSCDGGEISYLLKDVPLKYGYYITYTICTKEYEYSAATISCLALLAVLCMMVLIGTAYDYAKKRRKTQSMHNGGIVVDHTKNDDGEHVSESNNTMNSQNEVLITRAGKTKKEHIFVRFILCFSLLINGGKILNTKQGDDSLGVLNGIRVISLWWVILGHTYSTALFLFSNIVNTLDATAQFTFQAIVNGTFSVDSFFFLSGLLITYITLTHINRNNGKMNWGMFYVHRYIRLTPVYAIVIFLFTTLTPHFGTGPLYSYSFDPNPDPGIENSVTYCQQYWWTNLLYINNLYPSKLMEECLAWGWYLANDMQFFAVSPLILYFLYHYFFIGVAIWTVLLLGCLGSLIGISIKHDITTKFLPDPGEVTMTASDALYIKPWARISPYLVGMLMGYILYKYRGRVRMSKLTNLTGWIVATGIGIAVVYGLYGNYHDHPLNDVSMVVYVTLSRFSWAVALAWVAFACATGYGGPINTLLSWSFWIPLARINYCAYLIHPIIISVFYLTLPNMIYYTDFLMAYFFLGNLVLSYAGAFVLSLFVEGPFMALEKLILNRDKSV